MNTAVFGTWEELSPAEAPNTFVCRCTRCGTVVELKAHSYRSYNVKCRVCIGNDEKLGFFKGHNLLNEVFGHWRPIERLETGDYKCECIICHKTCDLNLQQFFYYRKKCPTCKPPKYKIIPGQAYGDWEALDDLGNVRCRFCGKERLLKVTQFVYTSCRKHCECQYQVDHKSERKHWFIPVIGETYGIWKIKAHHKDMLFVCECTGCHFERLLVGYRVVYPKYAPRCHNCPKVRQCNAPVTSSPESSSSPGSKQTSS